MFTHVRFCVLAALSVCLGVVSLSQGQQPTVLPSHMVLVDAKNINWHKVPVLKGKVQFGSAGAPLQAGDEVAIDLRDWPKIDVRVTSAPDRVPSAWSQTREWKVDQVMWCKGCGNIAGIRLVDGKGCKIDIKKEQFVINKSSTLQQILAHVAFENGGQMEGVAEMAFSYEGDWPHQFGLLPKAQK